jgi:L-fuculose-phosphate aldolase
MGTALACVLEELPAVHYQMVELGGPVPVARYATFGTEELARLTLDALEGRCAVLMANHGSLTYGDDLDGAVGRCELLEWACTLYWRAACVGAPRALDEEQLAAVRDALESRNYGSMRGSADREPGSHASDNPPVHKAVERPPFPPNRV